MQINMIRQCQKIGPISRAFFYASNPLTLPYKVKKLKNRGKGVIPSFVQQFKLRERSQNIITFLTDDMKTIWNYF